MKAWPLQQAIYSRLAGFAALVALVGARVYDRVPPSTAFPYVVIGDDTAVPFDTHSSVGARHTVTIHVWSRDGGRDETKRIQQAIYDALHRNALVVAGAETVNCEWEFSESFLEQDGLTRHGVMRLAVVLDGVGA